MEEVWKDIRGFEGFYEVSSYGRLRRNGKFLSTKTKSKYQFIGLFKNGTRTAVYVHRLVAAEFLPNPPCCPTCGTTFEVNHKDGNSHNNFAENLEYVTRKENLAHSKIKAAIGMATKLTPEMVEKIKEKLLNTSLSSAEIGRQYGVTRSTICGIKKGRNWKHSPNK